MGGVKPPLEYSALKGTGLKSIFSSTYQNTTMSRQKARWTFRIWHHLMYEFFSLFSREEQPRFMEMCPA